MSIHPNAPAHASSRSTLYRRLRRSAFFLFGGSICLLIHSNSIAQAAPSTPVDSSSPTSPPQPPTPWSFFGGFTAHGLSAPGLHLGAEYALATAAHFGSLAAFSLQAHHRSNSETGVALHARWGQRYTASFGLTFDSYLGLGVQYTHYDIIVFEAEGSVTVPVRSSASRFAFSPHIVFGPGYDFAPLLRIPLHVYARPGVVLVYPELNQAFQVAAIAELGLRWTPNW